MKKSVKIRKLIFEILYEIYNKSVNFDESFLKQTTKIIISDQDKSMIYNVVLNSIRYNFFIKNILNKYLKKKTSIKIKILLLSAITQIFYLNFKDYAVTNDSVEIAKLKKLNPGLINGLLKNLIKNEAKINKRDFNISDFPHWFLDELKKNKTNPIKLLNNICCEPSLHLVFKNKKLLDSFKTNNHKTSEQSTFIKDKNKIQKIEGYENGIWWIQDFSSMLPIYLSPEIKSKNVLDMCSAPGGKAFQLLSTGSEVTLNDISIKRSYVLKNNLKRLGFKEKILNLDANDLCEKQKYDVVILDSPCSGVGTLRRNPDILFKKNAPNLNKLSKIQKNLINKAGKLLNKNGILIFMVCSILNLETKNIKKFFLRENSNFSQLKFNVNDKKLSKFIDDQGDIYCTPSEFNSFMIDGFYSVKFIKND